MSGSMEKSVDKVIKYSAIFAEVSSSTSTWEWTWNWQLLVESNCKGHLQCCQCHVWGLWLATHISDTEVTLGIFQLLKEKNKYDQMPSTLCDWLQSGFCHWWRRLQMKSSLRRQRSWRSSSHKCLKQCIGLQNYHAIMSNMVRWSSPRFDKCWWLQWEQLVALHTWRWSKKWTES